MLALVQEPRELPQDAHVVGREVRGSSEQEQCAREVALRALQEHGVARVRLHVCRVQLHSRCKALERLKERIVCVSLW
jgi:hypothetical protein